MQLFKYMPIVTPSNAGSTKAKIDNKMRLVSIANNNFWFAKPENLNDPFDCKPEFREPKGFRETEKIIQELSSDEIDYLATQLPGTKTKSDVIKRYKLLYDNGSISIPLLHSFTKRLVQVRMSNMGVLSLSETNSNCLMWTHYAKNHSGICVEYYIPENTRGLDKVRYRQRQPVLSINQAFSEKSGKLLEMLYTKSIHWKYEKEWRVARLEGNKLYNVMNARTLNIYFGINVSSATKKFVKRELGNNFNYIEMRLDRNFGIKEKN